MKEIMFRRVPLWLVGLIVVGLLGLAFLFGVVVRDATYGKNRLGAVSRAAYAIASFPSDVARAARMLVSGDLHGMATLHSDRFPGQAGWRFFDERLASGLDGYLLFSRHDGNVGHHVLELVDLAAGETVHRIDLDADRLFAKATPKTRFTDVAQWTTPRFQAVHPLPLDNGDIIVKGFLAPLVRMTPCGDPVWTLDYNQFHHTIERGPDGNFWGSTVVDPPRVAGIASDFQDTGLVEFSEAGEVLYDRSLADLMLDHGLGYLFLAAGTYTSDPLHLNDVQPVFEDGPYWKRGDLFLSLRHLSMIVLFRPSTDEIVWWKQGPWSAQHDVDVIDDTTIAIYNNNAYSYGHSDVVDDHSHINYYDFATDRVSSPFAEVLARHEVRNEAAGLFTLLPDGHLYVDESESGRTLFFTPAGELAAEHVNRADNGLIYHLGWSRYLDRTEGDALLERLRAADCG